MNNPRITVFIPVYNGAHFLADAIESILNQSFKDFELLVIDDGSTDNSVQIAESYTDYRIRLIKNGSNRGISFTRNFAIQEARGEFLALLDADDIAFSDRLEKQLVFLDNNPDVKGCGSHAVIIDSEGLSIGEILKYPVEVNKIKVGFLFRNVFVNSTVMYRLASLKSSKGYYDGLCEDYEMAVQLNSRYSLANIDEVLVYYRKHDNNVSKVYAQEMIVAEKHVIRCIHDQLDIANDPLLVSVHHTIMIGDEELIYTLRDYENLLEIIRESNDRKGIYPKEELSSLLFRVLYSRVNVANDRKSVFEFLNSSLFQLRFLSMRMIRKMIKQAFWIRKAG